MLIYKNAVYKNRVNGGKYKNIWKSGNKKVKILAKPKSWNLPMSRLKNLFKSKKNKNNSAKEKTNFFISNTRVAYTKLK